jgi:hypothetical protein
VSDYGLDCRPIGVRSPAGVKDFSCSLGPTQPPVQWVSGVKRGRGVTLTTQPHLMPRSILSRSYTSSPLPPATPWRVAGLLCLLYVILLTTLRSLFPLSVELVAGSISEPDFPLYLSTFYYFSPVYAYVFQAVSSKNVSRPTLYMHFSKLPFVLHVLRVR